MADNDPSGEGAEDGVSAATVAATEEAVIVAEEDEREKEENEPMVLARTLGEWSKLYFEITKYYTNLFEREVAATKGGTKKSLKNQAVILMLIAQCQEYIHTVPTNLRDTTTVLKFMCVVNREIIYLSKVMHTLDSISTSDLFHVFQRIHSDFLRACEVIDCTGYCANSPMVSEAMLRHNHPAGDATNSPFVARDIDWDSIRDEGVFLNIVRYRDDIRSQYLNLLEYLCDERLEYCIIDTTAPSRARTDADANGCVDAKQLILREKLVARIAYIMQKLIYTLGRTGPCVQEATTFWKEEQHRRAAYFAQRHQPLTDPTDPTDHTASRMMHGGDTGVYNGQADPVPASTIPPSQKQMSHRILMDHHQQQQQQAEMESVAAGVSTTPGAGSMYPEQQQQQQQQQYRTITAEEVYDPMTHHQQASETSSSGGGGGGGLFGKFVSLFGPSEEPAVVASVPQYSIDMAPHDQYQYQQYQRVDATPTETGYGQQTQHISEQMVGAVLREQGGGGSTMSDPLLPHHEQQQQQQGDGSMVG